MQNNALKVSEGFKNAAVKSVLSIVLFLSTYLVLIILGLGVILLCGLIAYSLVMLKAMFITGMLGLGFIGMGFLIFFFLIKFIFSSPNKVDRSHLVEITEQQQPQLFKMIREIVEEVKTSFPKKVYLSSDVNAAVFYDSNFWSMFFPVRKNLQIGLGLMNAVSPVELKAILAHEFGHFSQRSMKVGSYVYNVNKVIYNMLYDNDSYGSLLNRWSNISSYFVLFSRGSILVIRGIQYVLRKVYRVLNLNYMALSREMEFHADAVAASVAGSKPLASSLLRLGLADQSLSTVFYYYSDKIAVSQKTTNFYPQQHFVLNQLALAESMPIQGGLPDLSIDVYKKFNKTKLVLDNQWSSHPSTEERVAKLLALDLPVKDTYEGIAIDLLADKESIQEMITARMFEGVEYKSDPGVVGPGEFIEEYLKREQENAYPEVFKGYYNARSPYIGFIASDFSSSDINPGPLNLEQLIDEQSLADIHRLATAVSDKETIERIKNGELEVSTFDYDGTKYSAADTYALSTYLENEIAELKTYLDEKDAVLFYFFLCKADELGIMEDFKVQSLSYQTATLASEVQQEVYLNLANATYFMQSSTPVETITEKMLEVKKAEVLFKQQIKLMLDAPLYQEFIEAEMRKEFEDYLEKDFQYFCIDTYFNNEVDILYNVMANFSEVAYKSHIKMKKELLEFQAGMISG